MTQLPQRGDARLGRVTARPTPTDGLAARLRLEGALRLVDWCPAELPAAALLIIRRMTVPATLPQMPDRGAFAGRVSGAVRSATQSARRPWIAPDADRARAVLFADEAELVACLMRDLLRGRVADRWWWHSVLCGVGAQEWLRRHVLPRGDLLVPALAMLAAGSEAAAWVGTVDAGEAERAAAVVERAYAVASRGTSHDRGPPISSNGADRSRRSTQRVAFERLLVTVPEARTATLNPPQRRLLALALALARAPSWARSAQCAVALEMLGGPSPAPETRLVADQLKSHAHTPRMGEVLAPLPEESRRESAAGDSPRDSGRSALRPVLAPGGAPKEAKKEGRREGRPLSTRAVPAAGGQASAEPGDESVMHEPPGPEQLLQTRNAGAAYPPATVDSTEQAKAPPAPRLTQGPSVEPPTIEDASVHTQFGGIFYLLNAAIATELYGDFTAPREPGISLSPWDWLALAGRFWFAEAFEHDPVWSVLASLAVRDPRDSPGREFEAPTSWAVHDSWLAPWGEVPRVLYGATATRVRILHPDGFVLFDVPRDPRDTPAGQARALCRGRSRLSSAALQRTRRVVLHNRARSATARWMSWLLGYLRARLARALGLEPNADVPGFVCRHDARLVSSLTAVDVHLSLAALPLAIRIAGLDRDPGWIPAAGRAVVLHFE